MTLPTLQPLELPRRCCSGLQSWWTTSCACSMCCPCSSASVSSQAVAFPFQIHFVQFSCNFGPVSETLFRLILPQGYPSCTVGCPASTPQPSWPAPLCCQWGIWPCCASLQLPWLSLWSVRTSTLMTECWSLKPGKKPFMLEVKVYDRL